MEKTDLRVLTDGVLSKMQELNYSQDSIRSHKIVYGALIDYARSVSVDVFSEEFGMTFLEKFSTFGHKRAEKMTCLLGSRGEIAASAIRKLGEFQQCKSFSRHPVSVKLEQWTMDDHEIMLAYDHSFTPIDPRKTTISERLKRLRKFYLYLEGIGLRSIKFGSFGNFCG